MPESPGKSSHPLSPSIGLYIGNYVAIVRQSGLVQEEESFVISLCIKLNCRAVSHTISMYKPVKEWVSAVDKTIFEFPATPRFAPELMRAF